MIKRVALILTGWSMVLFGGVAFAFTGRTPARSYQWFIRLFCLTGGRSNDILGGLIGLLNRPSVLGEGRAVSADAAAARLIQPLEGREFDLALTALRERGYFILPKRISAEVCARLREFALAEPSTIRADDYPTEFAGQRRAYGQDRGAPRGVRYDFAMQDILRNQDVQTLMSDPTLLALSQAYFGSAPRADVLGLWWNTAFNSRPSDNAAQKFHFDLDRVKWLKVFIYLTDVEVENGPHSFVAGSHRTGAISADLLRRGYVRLDDEDIAQRFRAEDVIEFCGSVGTVIVEDTRGLHKGKLVERGDRLVLQLQFSNSLFGAAYEKALLPETRGQSGALRAALAADRRVFGNFL